MNKNIKNNLINLNHKIIRLINEKNIQIGILNINDAILKAKDSGLNLVLLDSKSNPPIYKIIDYGKFLYIKNKKIKNKKKINNKNFNIKEIKLKPNIENRDYDIKLEKIIFFLKNKKKVKITLQFRGREIMHKDIGINLLKKICNDVKDISNIDKFPNKVEGRQIIIFLSYKNK